MVNSIGFNPVKTTNFSGSFNVESVGYVQGMAFDDPAIRNQLSGGVLATDEVLPMWGGVGIYENIGGAIGAPSKTLGGTIGRATQLGAAAPAAKSLTGFSVFDQAHHMVQTPSSEVPISLSGMSVHFYRLGTGARLQLAIDPALISLVGGLITQQVSWDFVNQKIIAPVGGSILPVEVLDVQATNCMTVSFDNVTGFVTWNRNGAVALVRI